MRGIGTRLFCGDCDSGTQPFERRIVARSRGSVNRPCLACKFRCDVIHKSSFRRLRLRADAPKGLSVRQQTLLSKHSGQSASLDERRPTWPVWNDAASGSARLAIDSLCVLLTLARITVEVGVGWFLCCNGVALRGRRQ
jgi:hypothetical protein